MFLFLPFLFSYEYENFVAKYSIYLDAINYSIINRTKYIQSILMKIKKYNDNCLFSGFIYNRFELVKNKKSICVDFFKNTLLTIFIVKNDVQVIKNFLFFGVFIRRDFVFEHPEFIQPINFNTLNKEITEIYKIIIGRAKITNELNQLKNMKIFELFNFKFSNEKIYIDSQKIDFFLERIISYILYFKKEKITIAKGLSPKSFIGSEMLLDFMFQKSIPFSVNEILIIELLQENITSIFFFIRNNLESKSTEHEVYKIETIFASLIEELKITLGIYSIFDYDKSDIFNEDFYEDIKNVIQFILCSFSFLDCKVNKFQKISSNICLSKYFLSNIVKYNQSTLNHLYSFILKASIILKEKILHLINKYDDFYKMNAVSEFKKLEFKHIDEKDIDEVKKSIAIYSIKLKEIIKSSLKYENDKCHIDKTFFNIINHIFDDNILLKKTEEYSVKKLWDFIYDLIVKINLNR